MKGVWPSLTVHFLDLSEETEESLAKPLDVSEDGPMPAVEDESGKARGRDRVRPTASCGIEPTLEDRALCRADEGGSCWERDRLGHKDENQQSRGERARFTDGKGVGRA